MQVVSEGHIFVDTLHPICLYVIWNAKAPPKFGGALALASDSRWGTNIA